MQVRAPMPPSYMFVIDVSVAAVACGMLTAVVDGIKSALDDMVSSCFSSQGAGLYASEVGGWAFMLCLGPEVGCQVLGAQENGPWGPSGAAVYVNWACVMTVSLGHKGTPHRLSNCTAAAPLSPAPPHTHSVLQLVASAWSGGADGGSCPLCTCSGSDAVCTRVLR